MNSTSMTYAWIKLYLWTESQPKLNEKKKKRARLI